MMMHLARLAGFEHETDLRAQRVFHQMMMHRAGGHQSAQRNAVGGDGAVGKNGEAEATGDGGLGLGANTLERDGHADGAFGFEKRDVDFLGPPAAIIHPLERVQFLVGENGMRQTQALAVGLGGVDQIFLGANVALERHNDFLANGIDGGIGHLREELAEVIVKHPRLIAETGERGVVAHRADGIAQLVDERQQHELHRLGGEPEGLHPLAERVRGQTVRGAGGGKVVQLDALVAEPFAVRAARGKVGLDFLIGNHRAFFEIDEEHPARLQASLGFHVGGIHGNYAHFAGHNHAVVVREIIATGAQAVAVEHGADVFAVCERDGRGAIPRLHQTGIVLVKIALGLRHLAVFLPRLGHHQQHGFLQRPAAHQQKFQRVVEVARVGTFRLHNGIKFLQVVAEQLAPQRAFARAHPVDVAAHRVDFAVVAHKPKRLRAIPTRKRVGRKPRVHHREMRLEIGIAQVIKVVEQLIRGEHPLVNHHLGGQAANVKQQRLFKRSIEAQLMAGAFADDVKLALKVIALHALGCADEKLHDARFGRARTGADVGLVRLHRHGAPTEAGLALLGDDAFNRGDALGAFGFNLRQKNQPRAEVPLGGQLHAHLLAGDLFEKTPRQAGEDAAAIAGVGLAAARAAMVHIFEHLNGIEHNLMARHALHISHKAHAAAILLIGGIVQALLFGEPNSFNSVTHSI